jgi:hypothetical protein
VVPFIFTRSHGYVEHPAATLNNPGGMCCGNEKPFVHISLIAKTDKLIEETY